MKITLYDGQTINFKDTETFKEVLDTLQTIFNNEIYQRYYGFVSSTNEISEDIKANKNFTNERWLGIKPVGKPTKEHVKNTLDAIGWILFKHNEYDCSKDIKEYNKLHKKFNSGKISNEEKVNFNSYKNNIFFNKNNMLLYINKPEEERLYEDNTNNSLSKLQAIELIKKDIIMYDKKNQHYIKEINKLKNKLKDATLDLTKEYINKILDYQDRIITYKFKIKELIQQYKYLTEKIVKPF
jgi:hypothetical protein